MAMRNENVQTEDTGLLTLWLFLRLHGVNAAFDQIRERCGTTTVGIRAMLRCAGQLGIGTRSRTTHWKRLVSMRLPGIASLRDGGFLLLGRADDDGALVLYPTAPHPKLITRAEFVTPLPIRVSAGAAWRGSSLSGGAAWPSVFVMPLPTRLSACGDRRETLATPTEARLQFRWLRRDLRTPTSPGFRPW